MIMMIVTRSLLSCYSSNNPSVVPVTPPTSPVTGQEAPPPLKPMRLEEPSLEPSITLEGGSCVSNRLVEKVWQDATISSGMQVHR